MNKKAIAAFAANAGMSSLALAVSIEFGVVGVLTFCGFWLLFLALALIPGDGD